VAGEVIEYIWDWIVTVRDRINEFIQGIWSTVQNVTNTGQGILAGLSAFGSMIWDALQWLGSALFTGLGWLYDLGEQIGKGIVEGLKGFGEWLWNTLANLPNAIFSTLQWIYNGLIWLGQQLWIGLQNIANWFVNLFTTMAEAINSWIEGWRNAVNEWFTNLFLNFRNKLKQTIVSNLTITLTWKAMERAVSDLSLKSIAGAIISPIAVPIGASVIANVVDSMIPTPSTRTVEIVPPFTLWSWSPPSLSIPFVGEKPYPTLPTVGIGYGLPYDVSLALPDTYVEAYTRSTDRSLSTPDLSHNETVESSDRSLSLPDLSYETEVA